MADDLLVVISVSADDVAKCHRLMDLQEMLRKKFLEAAKELDTFLLPEFLHEAVD